MQRIIIGVMIALVVFGVAAGFATIGSPFDARTRALDRRAMSDLEQMARTISWEYDAPTSRLPERYDQSGTSTLRPISYRRLDDRHFELCTTFETEQSAIVGLSDDDSDGWAHGTGRYCHKFDVRPRSAR